MTDYFLTQAGSLIMSGPTDIMVSLGIEYISGITLEMAYMYYNYIAVALMFFFAAFAGARSESRFLVVIPFIGGILFWVGWVHTGDQTKFLAFLIITALLGVFSYMNDANHEKYGVGGPGSKLLGIVFFIIMFQAAVGVINGFDLFEAGVAQPTPNACTVGYQCDEYGNIKLSESIATVSGSGGLGQDILAFLSTLPVLAVSLLKLVVTIVTSVALFSVVLNATINGIFPGISSNIIYVGFMALMQVGIWGIYLMTIFTWYYKPMPGEGTL